MISMNIKHLDTKIEIESCFKLMKVLRPKMQSPSDFVEQVLRQQKTSYRILAIEEQGKIVALAGYRESENLIYGKFIYVDDLVTDPDYRSLNMGQTLLKHISGIAHEKLKKNVVLDTGIANSQAQKFYYRESFLALGMHFVKAIKTEG
jgi:ribosomal protein S18 acetylase RimI-like enzyme